MARPAPSLIQMRTGRLLKFQRPEGEVHAYLFREEGGGYSGVLYVLSGPPTGEQDSAHTVLGRTEAEVETGVRAWVDLHFPRR